MIGLLKRHGFLKRPAFLNPVHTSPKNALGLDEAPLMAGETNRFYFDFTLLTEQISRIKILSTGRNLVTFVIGERGSGKTTLLNHFLQKSVLSWEYYRLQLPTDEGEAASHEGYPLFISKEGEKSRLVMDDAHLLSSCEMKQVLASAWSSTRRRKLGGIIFFVRSPILIDNPKSSSTPILLLESLFQLLHRNEIPFNQNFTQLFLSLILSC